MKLNLGCGTDIREDYVNVDIHEPKADEHHDLNRFPWKWDDNSVQKIVMQHIWEHLNKETIEIDGELQLGNGVVKAFEEAYRILEPGGVLEVEVPHAKSPVSAQDPTHISYGFGYDTALYFCGESGVDFYTDAEFELVDRQLQIAGSTVGNLIERFANRHPYLYENRLFWISPPVLQFTLQKPHTDERTEQEVVEDRMPSLGET